MASFVVRQIGPNVEMRYQDIPLFHAAEARAVIVDLARLHLNLALQSIAGFISEEAPVGVSGNLAQSFAGNAFGGIEVAGLSLESLQGRIFSSLPYALVIDQGRRPGARMPPPDALRLWVTRKLGISGDAAEEVAFLIARSIARKGIQARRFVEAGLRRANPTVQDILASLADAITAALTAEGGAR